MSLLQGQHDNAGSVQCCAVNKCHCSKASMTVHEGIKVTGSVQCCAKINVTVEGQHDNSRGKIGYRFSAVLC